MHTAVCVEQIHRSAEMACKSSETKRKKKLFHSFITFVENLRLQFPGEKPKILNESFFAKHQIKITKALNERTEENDSKNGENEKLSATFLLDVWKQAGMIILMHSNILLQSPPPLSQHDHYALPIPHK